MVEGVSSKEEDWRPQGGRLTHSPRSRLWPVRPASTEADGTGCQEHRRPIAGPAGLHQEQKPPQRRDLRRFPLGVGLQWAVMSQEHEGVALRAVQREEEGAVRPSNTGERDRERRVREGGHKMMRRRNEGETALQRYLKRWRRGVMRLQTLQKVCWRFLGRRGRLNLQDLDCEVTDIEELTVEMCFFFKWWFLNHFANIDPQNTHGSIQENCTQNSGCIHTCRLPTLWVNPRVEVINSPNEPSNLPCDWILKFQIKNIVCIKVFTFLWATPRITVL